MIFLIFSSIEFLLWFLPIFLIVYGITPRKYRNLTLLVGSIVFYAMGDVRYLPLLMISILCNYFLGLHLAKRSPKTLWRKKLLLILTLGANLAVLLWFKDWGGSAGLPLGISFYTFQILSYQIDVYRGEVSREYSFLKFATYVIMFPKLISGPITRYGDISDSLTERTFTVRGLEDGMKLFILGLVVGYMRDQIRTMRAESAELEEHLSRQIVDIRDINESNVRVREVMEQQLVGQKDSLGKIYSITKQLDQSMPDEVVFHAVEMLTKLMETKDVAFYSVVNDDYARLFSASSEKARSLGNSIRYREMTEIYDELLEEKVYINKTMDERYPLMVRGIYEDGKLQMVIMLWA